MTALPLTDWMGPLGGKKGKKKGERGWGEKPKVRNATENSPAK